jgi:Mg2+/Co2+ transporter CorB
MITAYIIIAIICLILSAFFSAAEISITGSQKSFLLRQEQNGNKTAKTINNLLKNPNKMLTSLVIGNNIANIFFTTSFTALFIYFFGNNYFTLVSLLIISILLVFAEILPKTIAFSYANKLILILATPINLIIKLITPISSIFLFINRFILIKILRMPKETNTNAVFGSVDNLRGAIELFNREEESHLLVSKEKAMLHSILDLNEIQISDIINHRKDVFSVDINTPPSDLVKKLINCPYSRVPVYNNPNEIIGILSIKSVFKYYIQNNNSDSIDIKKLITTPYFVPETTYVLDLLESFKQKNERMAIIIDEYGSFMGILTLGDIIEEITGEIALKEQKNNVEEVKPNKNGFIVAGDLKIRDLNRKMNWKLPDEEFTTVAGLILYQTGKIPATGSSFVFNNFKFDVLEKKQHQLIKIRITPIVK